MRTGGINEFFRQLPSKLDVEAAEDLHAVYQFDLSGALGGQYTVTIQEGVCQVNEGRHEDPHVILSMAGEDCVKVLNGELSGPAAAMSGRIRISGDVGLAMQLRTLFPSISGQIPT
jgi:putative sterol carrier protein